MANGKVKKRGETVASLLCRRDLDESAIEALESGAIAMAHSLQAEVVPGLWRHSEVEDRYRPLLETLMIMPGFLRRFRRTFIAAGRHNFPDSPAPKANYLQWERLPRSQVIPGVIRLLNMSLRLYRHKRFKLSDLDDPCVGKLTYFPVPKTSTDALAAVARRLFKMTIREPAYYRVTEAQIRHFYYRTQIESVFGADFDTVLEIGAGFGGLCGEILAHWSVKRYIIVELPESVPLCWFYLSCLFDGRLQVLYRRSDWPDPEANILTSISQGLKLQERLERKVKG